MKWLIIQSSGEHEENLNFRECYAWKYALQNCGIAADVWGKRHTNFVEVPNFYTYDVVFIAEQWEFDFFSLASMARSSVGRPLIVQWLVDLHCDSQHYEPITPWVDICVHASRGPMELYKQKFPEKKHIWVPNGVDSRLFYDWSLTKALDLTFVGSVNNKRYEYLFKLTNDLGLQYFFKRGIQMISLISRSKIHFNQCIGDDLNYRIFETIGLGTCLCTNWHPDLYELGFRDGENCLMYKDYEEAKYKITTALDIGWAEIGQRAAQFALSHSYTARAQQIIKALETC